MSKTDRSFLEQFPWVARTPSILARVAQAHEEHKAAEEEQSKHAAAGNAEAAADAAVRSARALRLIGQLLNEARKRKDDWIAAARKEFSPGPREPCYVCKKFVSVTQAHHTVPLSEQYDQCFERPDHRHIWLCPTHHIIAHILIGPYPDHVTRGRAAARVIVDFDDNDEYQAMLRVLGMSGGGTYDE
jgi:hypothetical protein